MLGRAASLQAGRKENRWPTGGRGSRVGPHSGLDPKLLSGPRPLDFSDPIKAQRVPWGWVGGESCIQPVTHSKPSINIHCGCPCYN